jgi:hypothetical protein
MLSYNYALAAKYGYLAHYHCFQAGDDTFEIVERSHLHLLKQAKSDAFATTSQHGSYGLGMVLKEMTVSDTSFNFLSKVSALSPEGEYKLKRQAHRIANTGPVSMKDITTAELDSSV